jgi:hypothetical protein
MAAAEVPAPTLGLRVRLRHAHPCGSDVFTVGGVGADIRLFCEGCGSKIFVERPRWRARVVEAVTGGTNDVTVEAG